MELSKQTKFCENCGTEIDVRAKICPSCGLEVRPSIEEVSSAWYLVPFFFGIIGGLIAWYVNKDRNPKKARNFLIFGLLWGIIEVVIFWLFWAAIFAAIIGGYGYSSYF